MSLTYDQFIDKEISEKSLICWLEPAQRLLSWTLHDGSVYKRSVEHYVINVIQEGVTFEKVDSIGEIVSDEQYYFDDNNKILYLQSTGGIDPETVFTVIFYRIAFSTFEFIGPIDNNLREVEYLPIIDNEPNFRHELDHENQLGVALSSNSSMSFILEDFFIENYDRLEWKNKRVRVWSYSPDLPFEEKKLYFDGLIDDKSYTQNLVSFMVKDFIQKLSEDVPLELYSQSDGELPESVIGKPKRRIYGRVNGLKVISTNQVLDGFSIAGTWSGSVGQNVVTGVGGNITDILSPGDKVITDNESAIQFEVDTIISDNQFTVSEEIERSLSNVGLKADPETQTIRTGRNTEYLISGGHALKEATATVTTPIQFNRVKFDDTSDFTVGDVVTMNGETRSIKRVSAENIVTFNQSFNSEPEIGDIMTRNPVQKVYANKNQFIIDRDYTISNLSTGCKLIFDPLAEFNVALSTRLAGQVQFTNGSNEVLLSGIEVKANFKPRDWVKPSSPDYFNWYEILEVDEDNSKLVLRGTFSDDSYNGVGLIKRIRPITDDTIVTVECFGKTKDNQASGEFIETCPEVIKDILDEVGIANINEASFDLAKKTAPQLVSLALPVDIDSEAPKISDVIEKLNKSIFGSLHYNNDFEIEYNVLTAEKPKISPDFIIKDEDILDWSVDSTGKNIVRKVFGHYQHQDADRFTGEKAFKLAEFDNEYVQRVVEDTETKTEDFYLYNANDAQIMVERLSFISEISQSVIQITGKLHLGKFQINDKILLELDRIYARFGSADGLDQRKICIVSSISKSEDTIILKLDDLGNIWNRTGNITKDDAVDFTNAGIERIINGYITDSNELINSDQDTYRINLIG